MKVTVIPIVIAALGTIYYGLVKSEYCCIAAYIYTYKYMKKHNQTYYTNFNDERTYFFIKIYLSHFILERVDVGCVWEISWRRG